MTHSLRLTAILVCRLLLFEGIEACMMMMRVPMMMRRPVKVAHRLSAEGRHQAHDQNKKHDWLFHKLYFSFLLFGLAKCRKVYDKVKVIDIYKFRLFS